MHYFFLDIASHNGLIACLSKDSVISSREVSTRVRDHELIPLVEECLKEAGWEYQDLDRIACVVGPGGFTSLRVAVSFANTLIDQLEIKGAGVHLSDLYFERSEDRKNERAEDLYWIHSTKRDSLFVRGGKWKEPTLISVDEIPKDGLWMGELLDEQKEIIDAAGSHGSQLRSVSEILPEFVQGLEYSKKPLEPWYGRSG